MIRWPSRRTGLPGLPEELRRLLGLALAFVFALSSACATRQAVPELPAAQALTRETPSYALVIDASSSGSRVHVFQWTAGSPGGLPEIEAAPAARAADEDAWQLVVDGGLSDYARDPEQAGESLEPLLDFASGKLREAGADLSSAMLYLKATAGMRLVPEPARSAIMDDVRHTLAKSGFDFRKAEIISGQQEGLFGWISVNYLLGLLGRGTFPTVGALDLGGASTQITYVPVDFPESESAALELGGTTYRVYSHSYLGFGQDQARQAVADPACYPRGYPIPDSDDVGSGDFAVCREAIRGFLERDCAASRCSLMGVYQPPLYGDFFAFSGYGYVSRFFDLDQNLSISELERRASDYCATDWQRILIERPDPGGRKYLSTYCFNAAYVVTLLTEGLGFPPATDHILTPRDVQGSEVSWVLGSFLFELSAGID